MAHPDDIVLPCLVCGCVLGPACPGYRQPYAATAFSASGHYGSMFDPLIGATWLSVNVCDACLTAAGEQGRVHLLAEQHVQRPEPDAVLWTASRED
jgi:hypothetical protein